jgi:hypothetical protein
MLEVGSPQQRNNSNGGPIRNTVTYATIDTQTFIWSRDCCLGTSTDLVSSCLEIAECRRVCVWLRTPVSWKTELVLGNCERSTCLEASWLQEWEFVPEECKGWAHTRVWRLSDCKDVSSCWEITRRGHVEGVLCGTSLSVDARSVFGELLSVFNCSALSFWSCNKVPSE